ncbi:DUF2169 family type VI secretion system accessory protein [Serratia microhaemolytica]|uniref:DUF2169 family type VI secretion system accessory protein n=1 Tax=Serratia microhaemolytica TaxID=2675110 RepID=UPI000FDEB0C4|nr:DUF2169 domain-containing protein [Serratia microhaemolytica]
MEFRNLTPFATLCYKMLDNADQEHQVVVMQVSYSLQPQGAGVYHAQLQDQPATPLCLQDTYRGALNTSSVLRESDLAPYKPACDVIVNGTAIAPGGKPSTQFAVNLQLSSATQGVLLEKTLTVSGARQFQREALDKPWQLTEPEPLTHLPLDYRYAFGGECRIDADSDAAERLASECYLNETQRRAHPDFPQAPLAHWVCEHNPLGQGFLAPAYAEASQLLSWPAPHIEASHAPLTAEMFAQQHEHTGNPPPACLPQGFGTVGRAWLPRRTLAGTYDDTWLAERHPYLPGDFNFSYWNGAPADQQIAFPPADLTLQLTNMTPEGLLHTTLPGHRALVLLRLHNGAFFPQLMPLDTLIIDTDQRQLHLTYRLLLPVTEDIRVLEARFEVNPHAPLLRVASPQERTHGR